MTEAEWRACPGPQPMLEFLGTRASERKRRLFACACCRRHWHWVEGTPAAKAVEVAEAFADGRTTEKKMDNARKRADAEANRTYAEFRCTAGVAPYIAHMHASACSRAAATRAQAHPQIGFAVNSAILVAQTYAHEMTGVADTTGGDWGEHFRADTARNADVVREVFGNPFRPIAFDPIWRTSDVMLLASGIYDDRAFDQLPILADALQDAGCDSDDILAHLRDPHAAHVRGCWALDLVLGKE